jgi:hypothetical protein
MADMVMMQQSRRGVGGLEIIYWSMNKTSTMSGDSGCR